MNSLLARVTGQRVDESDVVPVSAGGLTRQTYRNRLQRERVHREDESSDVQRVIGESDKGIIPDNAEDIDDAGISVLPKRMRAIKDVVQEPSHPSGDREKLMTPYAALTAPDATPDAMTPLDPAKVPGKTSQSFTAGDLEKAAEEPPREEAPNPADLDEPGVDKATRTMDILLGRKRTTGAAPKNSSEMAQAGAITTEAAAYTALNIKPPGMAETIGAAMVPGTPMPAPVVGDAKVVCEAFRRYMG